MGFLVLIFLLNVEPQFVSNVRAYRDKVFPPIVAAGGVRLQPLPTDISSVTVPRVKQLLDSW